MSNIESLDRLREFVDEDALLVEMVEAVEHEVAERFMPLPCDAYGVPIRPDDLMACTAFDTNDFDGKEHVLAVGNGFWVDKDGLTHIPSETRHVKPRTIEDVLREFAEEVYASHADFISIDGENAYLLAAINETADEIRELMGVSE